MSSSKREMLNKTISFIELLIEPSVHASTSPEQASASINAFRAMLRGFNEDPSNEESRPFMLIHSNADEVLEESFVNSILIEADKHGLSREFKKVEVNGYVMGFFSHKAKTFVDDFIKGRDIAYMNMLANGLVFDDFHCVGFYTASESRLRATLIELQSYVRLS